MRTQNRNDEKHRTQIHMEINCNHSYDYMETLYDIEMKQVS